MTDWAFDAWPEVAPDWGDASQGDSPYDNLEFHVDIGCGRSKKARIGIDKYPDKGVNVVMDLDTGAVAAVAPEPGRDAAERLGNGWRYRTPGLRAPLHGEETPYLDYPTAAGFPTSWGPSPGGEVMTIAHGLPFPENSIESIISHHCLEHLGDGFVPLVDDVYRVLKPGAIFRAITPLFPSRSSIDDPTHKRLITESTWQAFCGRPGEGGHWYESFATPYMRARFQLLDQDITPRVGMSERWTDTDAREIRVALRAVK